MRRKPREEKVLNLVKRIPRGYVSTYKLIARTLGWPNAARFVGRVLSKNPHLVKIPCHRVIKSSGAIGDYQKGSRQKVKLLLSEGISLKAEDRLADLSQIYYFKDSNHAQ